MTQSSHPHHPSSSSHLAALALSTQGKYGAVTDLACQHGIRRQEVYALRVRAWEALEAEVTPTAPELRECLRLDLAQPDIERAVVALRVITPASIRDIVEVLPLLYGVEWSYGTVCNVLDKAERRAKAVLEKVDLSGIDNIAVDEMFSQGRPVLAGIDLDTQYLFQLEVHNSRSGETWAESLGALRDRQGLNPKRVVKDAGTGLRAGVRACWPDIEEHDDLFHAVYMMGQEAYHLERGAYRAIRTVDELETRRAKAKSKTETQRRSLGQQLRKARKRMDEAIERYDRFEVLRREAGRALELTDRGSGKLRTSGEVVEVLTRAAAKMDELGGRRVRKVAKYIGNRAESLGRYLDSLEARLKEVTEEAGGDAVVEASVRAGKIVSMRKEAKSNKDVGLATALESLRFADLEVVTGATMDVVQSSATIVQHSLTLSGVGAPVAAGLKTANSGMSSGLSTADQVPRRQGQQGRRRDDARARQEADRDQREVRGAGGRQRRPRGQQDLARLPRAVQPRYEGLRQDVRLEHPQAHLQEDRAGRRTADHPRQDRVDPEPGAGRPS